MGRGNADNADHAAASAIAKADAADLARDLEARERATRRHTIWALLGMSPAGLLPLVLTASEAGGYALIAGLVAVSGVEATRALRARAEAASLRERLRRLTSSSSTA